jgi:formylglycine-generating enzyme required for sulfatase activity
MNFAVLPLTATRLELGTNRIHSTAQGGVEMAIIDALLSGNNVIVLGTFGSGKTSLCDRISKLNHPGMPPCTPVPLRVVARSPDCESGLRLTIGEQRLVEAQQGQRILLLDGFDEISSAQVTSHQDFYAELTSIVGPTWLMTSRPGYFRTEVPAAPDQIDTLEQPGTETLLIDPLPATLVRDLISSLPGGHNVIQSVAGLEQLSTSPILLKAAHAAMPYIELGRPIQPWGLFDAWIRHEIDEESDPEEAMARLTELAWTHFKETNFAIEDTGIRREHLHAARIPPSLRRSIFVTELDGLSRFGHRSVYEFFLAAAIAPRLLANQGLSADELSERPITEAVRAFTVGRIPVTPVICEPKRAYIPAGNFIAGGERALDERPLRITHLEKPTWIARIPVTHENWSKYMREQQTKRFDANYLPHWGPDYQMPPGFDQVPIYGIWPEDADSYAAWSGARLPSADEWEKAVRGIDGRYWPWGDHWHSGAAVTAEFGVSSPLPARAFGAQGNAQLFAAVGNVFEYTRSQWKSRENRGRVVMGGAYSHPYQTSRASLRLSHKMSGNLPVGLRLAWDAE